MASDNDMAVAIKFLVHFYMINENVILEAISTIFDLATK